MTSYVIITTISIHTTRKVVTTNGLHKVSALKISIHTTRKVVTMGCREWSRRMSNFNPHHPQGGDLVMLFTVCCSIISIHTTRKVVTSFMLPSTRMTVYFNPHHPQGGDDAEKKTDVESLKFQSTPPARW